MALGTLQQLRGLTWEDAQRASHSQIPVTQEAEIGRREGIAGCHTPCRHPSQDSGSSVLLVLPVYSMRLLGSPQSK